VIEETSMGNVHFEVLPVGSLNELKTIRPLLAELIDRNKQKDFTGVQETIKKIEQYYKDVI
jgi:hypothetical protein